MIATCNLNSNETSARAPIIVKCDQCNYFERKRRIIDQIKKKLHAADGISNEMNRPILKTQRERGKISFIYVHEDEGNEFLDDNNKGRALSTDRNLINVNNTSQIVESRVNEDIQFSQTRLFFSVNDLPSCLVSL